MVTRPVAVVELTDAYDDFARSARRGLAMIEGRRAVLVQDEFEIKTPCEVAWGMTTDAEIDVKETDGCGAQAQGQGIDRPAAESSERRLHGRVGRAGAAAAQE